MCFQIRMDLEMSNTLKATEEMETPMKNFNIQSLTYGNS